MRAEIKMKKQIKLISQSQQLGEKLSNGEAGISANIITRDIKELQKNIAQ